MASYVFDIETDGLLDSLTRIHILVLRDVDTGEVLDFSDVKHGPGSIEKGVRLLQAADLLIGHNIIKFDIPAIQKLYPWFTPPLIWTEEDVANGRGSIDTLTCTRLIWADIATGDAKRVLRGKMPGKLTGSHKLEAWGYRMGLQKGDYSEIKAAEGKALGIEDAAEIIRYTWAEWNQEMHDYCILDTEVTLALWKRIQSKGVPHQAVWLEHRFAAIIAQQERYGFAFDREAAVKLYTEVLVPRRLEIAAQLREVFPARYQKVAEGEWKRDSKRWHTDALGAHQRLVKKQVFVGFYEEQQAGSTYSKIEWTEFNASSRHHIAQRLKEKGWVPEEFTPSGQPKIDETILEKLPYPEAQVLAEHFLIEKRIGQLAEGDQAWLRLERDGRIHGSVNTNGAVTGRCTHSNPNVAQVPKVGSQYGAECRALFTASVGRVLVGIDLSGLELRCLAHFMARHDGGEYGRVLLEGDIHWANVKALGLTNEDRDDSKLLHKLFRNAAKTFIYAFLYGAGDVKIGTTIYELVVLAARQNGYEGWLDLQQKFFKTLQPPTEADLRKAGKRLKKTFMDKTPALKKLKEAVTLKAKAAGALVGLDGRSLHIRSDHAALNTLLQSAGALIAKLCTVLAYDALSARGLTFGKEWALVAHIHDELQIDCKKELADEIGRTVVDGMRRAGELFAFRIPIDGEASAPGRNWADTH